MITVNDYTLLQLIPADTYCDTLKETEKTKIFKRKD